MTGDFEIDWLRSSRIAELQAFLDAEWRAGHVLARDEELLRWQHPRGDDELSFVAATERGKLVGVLGVIPVEFGARGDRLSGAWLTTWAVTPAARQRRVGLQLLEFALDRHEFAGTLGGNTTTMTILRALRFHTEPAVPRWVRPLDGAALARLTNVRPPELPDMTPTLANFTVREWTPDATESWDRLWGRSLAPKLVGTWRDAAYLEWRYLSHPRFRYVVQVAESRVGEIAGLLVYRVEKVQGTKETVVRIVEALGDSGAVTALVGSLVGSGRELGAAFADFYCTGSRFAAPLEHAGFVRETGNGPTFPSHFQPLQQGARSLTAALWLAGERNGLDGDNAYFTRSDCDQDRPNRP